MLIQEYLDICDPVLTFDRLMGGIKLEEYVEKVHICGEGRNRYSKTDHSATFM